jgi:Uma2 family endonuclease
MATVETAPAPERAPQRFVLHGVSWQTYLELSDSAENEHVRMTYDRGELELMTLSRQHEQYASFLEYLIRVWAEETGTTMGACRSMTIRRQDLDRGFEPDNCYYLSHAAMVRGKKELDFTVDPPPDLAVEIEVSRKAIGKLPMYAAFGVPEVWRYDGRMLQAYLLADDGQYRRSPQSGCFPQLPFTEVEQLLARLSEADETELAKSFRASARAIVAVGLGERQVIKYPPPNS